MMSMWMDRENWFTHKNFQCKQSPVSQRYTHCLSQSGNANMHTSLMSPTLFPLRFFYIIFWTAFPSATVQLIVRIRVSRKKAVVKQILFTRWCSVGSMLCALPWQLVENQKHLCWTERLKHTIIQSTGLHTLSPIYKLNYPSISTKPEQHDEKRIWIPFIIDSHFIQIKLK